MVGWLEGGEVFLGGSIPDDCGGDALEILPCVHGEIIHMGGSKTGGSKVGMQLRLGLVVECLKCQVQPIVIGLVIT